MDIKRAMAAVNEFQNSLDRIRPMVGLLTAAKTAWEELSQFNPDELQNFMNQKTALEGQVAQLTRDRDNLQNSIAGLASTYDGKRATLERELEARKNSDEATHAERMKKNLAEISALESEIDHLSQVRTNMTQQLHAEKTTLENQINALKAQIQAMLHA